MQIKKTRELTAQDEHRADFIVYYVRQLRDLFGHYIINAQHSAEFEGLELPEDVIKTFSFAPLFNPIMTFAVDFQLDVTDADNFRRFGLLLELREALEAIRLSTELDKTVYCRRLLTEYSEADLDYFLTLMGNFLRICKKEIHNIYSWSVAYYYGNDGYSEALLYYNEMQATAPYIRNKVLARRPGEYFANVLVIAIEGYFSPKLHQ